MNLKIKTSKTQKLLGDIYKKYTIYSMSLYIQLILVLYKLFMKKTNSFFQ